MATVIWDDIIVPEGEVRTYVQTDDNFFSAALLFGTDGYIHAEDEPSLTNYGEVHLQNTIGYQGILIVFSATPPNSGVIENYGLISCVLTENYTVTAFSAIEEGPDLHNAGTIIVQAKYNARGYAASYMDIANTAAGIIQVTATELTQAVIASYGGVYSNAGEILAHTTGGGRVGSAQGAYGFQLGDGAAAIFEFSITNSGLIEATDQDPTTAYSAAIWLRGDGLGSIVNSGTIRGSDYAILEQRDNQFVGQPLDITVQNSGIIEGHLALDVGNDLVRNTGEIIGNVSLGRNDDTYIGTNGAVTGKVSGDDGDDALYGGGENNQFFGGAGNDMLDGGAGVDQLFGGAGVDYLDGGAGNDFYIINSANEHGAAEFHDSGVDSFAIDLVVFTATTASTLTLYAGDTGIEQVFVGTEDLGSTDAAIDVDVSAVLGRINISGNAGANHLLGNAAINLMSGGAGLDVLEGGGGDDILDGGSGEDQLYGGTGNDTYYVDLAADQLFEAEGAGTDWVQAGTSYTLANGQEIEFFITADQSNGTAAIDLTGNEFDNAIFGNAAANQIKGGAGNDNLIGWGGNDTLRGDADDDLLQGGEGDDYLLGGIGNDSLIGGAGYDRMYGGAGDDFYDVYDSTDFAYENSGEGHDTVTAWVDHTLRANVEDLILTGAAYVGKGNSQDNAISGSDSANKLYGYDGDDRLGGAGGDDWLFGGNGNDILSADAGYDRMYGGTGDDTYYVTDTTDYTYEIAAEGTDRVIASINHQLRANIEELELSGSSDLRGYGNSLDNQLIGNSGANLLYGRDGQDSLGGNAGNDILYGENGNDHLTGGSGQDRFYGGAGSDGFIFNDGDFAGMSSATADRIHDFSQAEGDIIRLDGVDANSAQAGDQGFAFIGSGAFSHTAGELRYQQISGNTYVQGDTDGDGTADFWIRLDGLHTLGQGDFVF